MSELSNLINDSINSADEQDRIQAPITISHIELDSELDSELEDRTCDEDLIQFNNCINFSITFDAFFDARIIRPAIRYTKLSSRLNS